MAGEEAARLGCRGAVLNTISFQAPGFYERHGWREFAGSLVSRWVHRGFSWPGITVLPGFDASVEKRQLGPYRLAVHWNPQRTVPAFLRPSIACDGRRGSNSPVRSYASMSAKRFKADKRE
jgi:hypothetical protein